MIRSLSLPERRPTAGIIPMPLSSFWTAGTSPWRLTSKRSQTKSVDSWTEQVSALKQWCNKLIYRERRNRETSSRGRLEQQ